MEDPPVVSTQERIQPPDLLELMGDQELTVFGVTASLKSLAGMCPLDANDPRMTLEAQNEFIVSVVNEVGAAVKPDLEPYFSEVIEKLGEEKNFTVIEPIAQEAEQEHPVELKPDSQTPAEEIKPAPVPELPVTPPVAEQQRRAHQASEAPLSAEPPQDALPKENIRPSPNVVSEQTIIREVIPSFNEAAESPTDVVIVKDLSPIPALPEMASANMLNTEPIISAAETIAHNLAREIALPVAELNLPTPLEASDFEAFLEELPTINTQLSTLTETPLDPITFLHENAPKVEEIGWSAEIFKEPLDLQYDFIESLNAFTQINELPEADVETQQTIPKITETVSNRLDELEDTEKNLTAPIIQNIVGAIHGIHILETKHASPEKIETIKAQLQELCVSLFETLDIDYNDEDVQQFIQVLLSPDFRPQQTVDQKQPLDLARMGTSEARRTFAQLSSLTGISRQLHYIIGVFVLFCVRKPELATETITG